MKMKLFFSMVVLWAAACSPTKPTTKTEAPASDFGGAYLIAHGDSSFSIGWGKQRDSCWWVDKTDTIEVEYVVLVQPDGLLCRSKPNRVVHQYKFQQCDWSSWTISGRFPRMEDRYFIDGKLVELFMYRTKYGWSEGASQ